MSAHAPQTRDPFAPFIAEDGLEYEDFAAYILQTPLGCARNEHILAHRKAGRSEEAIRVWIKAYDGEDRTLSSQLDWSQQSERRIRAFTPGLFF